MAITFDVDLGRYVGFVSGPGTYNIRNVLRDKGCKWQRGRWEFPLVIDVAEMVEWAVTKHSDPPTVYEPNYSQWKSYEGVTRKNAMEALRDNKDNHPVIEHTWFKAGWDPPTKCMQHQIPGSQWLFYNYRCILGDDMGLGKTKESIDTACMMYLYKHWRKGIVVVVCPNGVKKQWEDQIEEHGWGVGNWVLIPRGSTKQRAEHITHFVNAKTTGGRQPLKWIILNYESLRWFKKTFHHAASGAVLICDEGHRLKNARAKQTLIVADAAPSYLWLLTGTQVSNRPEDLYSLITLVRPLWWKSWYEFDQEYLIHDKFGAIRTYKMLPHLNQRLAQVSFGRRKEQCIDLPPKIYTERTVTLNNAERKAYDRMRDELIAWLDAQEFEGGRPTSTQAANFAARYIRLRQLTHGLVSAGVDEGHSWIKSPSKTAELMEIWKDAGKTHMVVWCHFVPVVEKVTDAFLSDGVKAYEIRGGISLPKREKRIDQWKAEGGVLVANMDCAGEGQNFQVCDLEVFADLPHTPRQRQQCSDRLHRIGQTRSVSVIDLMAEDTVDRKVKAMLKKKLDWVAMTTAASYGKNPDEWREMLG